MNIHKKPVTETKTVEVPVTYEEISVESSFNRNFCAVSICCIYC
jgi:hypothetical protein